MAPRDYYQTLGVSSSATAEEIKRAFRKLAMELHPDKHGNSAAATETFSQINEAYAILSDPQKRAEYNYQRYLKNPQYKEKPLSRTAEDVLLLSRKLAADMQHRDPTRIDRDILLFQLMEILSTHNLDIIAGKNDSGVNGQIILNLVTAAAHLPFSYVRSVRSQLFAVAGSDAENIRRVTQFLKQSSLQYYWSRYKIYIALALAILFCYLISR